MNDHKKLTIETEFGQRARVEREEVHGIKAQRGNAALSHVGEAMNPKADALEYLGSAAVHIYKSPMLDQLFLCTQTSTLGTCPEILADKGMTQLRADMMTHFGRRAGTKRSGF